VADTENDAYDGLIRSFRRSLTAEGKSPKTIRGYVSTAVHFAEFGVAHGFPTDIAGIQRRHVEDFMIDVQGRRSDTTAATYFAHLQQFFRWLVEVEQELTVSPMVGMKRPSIHEAPPKVLARDEIKAVLKAASGTGFNERRDTAIVRVLADSGVRIGELVSMTVASLDLDGGRVLVHGKGDKSRWAAFGQRTALDLERYLRARKKHRHAGCDALWLGVKGPLTESGIDQMLGRRGQQAGVAEVHAHRFRHTWSHEFRLMGGNESDLQALGGWTTPQMLRRYGQSAAAERAVAAAHKHSLGDLL
jgi:site-specific recombinase XerD